MAVFMTNICTFDNCGITFPNLGDLISHIEDTHIDYDPHVVEQTEKAKPACLPLSYVLRFVAENAKKEPAAPLRPPEKQNRKNTKSTIKTNRSSTPPGSEVEDDDVVLTESEDSNDSWTTSEAFSADFILRHGSRAPSNSYGNQNTNSEKPFACPVPGCKKRYKNINGIKYHSKNGHKNEGKVRKAYKCHCGKSYKSQLRLKNHAIQQHGESTSVPTMTSSTPTIVVSSMSRPITPARPVTPVTPVRQIPTPPTTPVTTPISVRSVSLKQVPISSLSGLPMKTIHGIVINQKELLNNLDEKIRNEKNMQMAVPNLLATVNKSTASLHNPNSNNNLSIYNSCTSSSATQTDSRVSLPLTPPTPTPLTPVSPVSTSSLTNSQNVGTFTSTTHHFVQSNISSLHKNYSYSNQNEMEKEN